MRCDQNPFTCQREKEDKKASRVQISRFYWSFSSDIVAVKGLNGSKVLTGNSDYIFFFFNLKIFSIYLSILFFPFLFLFSFFYNSLIAHTQVQVKRKSFELRWNYFFPEADAHHVYVRASPLGCFHSFISAHAFWGAR